VVIVCLGRPATGSGARHVSPTRWRDAGRHPRRRSFRLDAPRRSRARGRPRRGL